MAARLTNEGAYPSAVATVERLTPQSGPQRFWGSLFSLLKVMERRVFSIVT